MGMILTLANLPDADVREVAEAVRRYCLIPWMGPRFKDTDWQKFAAALLDALDCADALMQYPTTYDAAGVCVIRAIARALIERGVRMEIEP